MQPLLWLLAFFVKLGLLFMAAAAGASYLFYRSYKLRLMPPYRRLKLPNGQILAGPNKLLGKGSFGAVCKFQLDNKSVAVKMPLSADGNALQQQELKLLQKAGPNHPNIIKVYDGYTIDKKLYIVMECMQGSLRDLLSAYHQIPWQTRLSLAKQLLNGLSHLHNLNNNHIFRDAIAHQDLKPENLLLDSLNPKGEIVLKITDFGIARSVNQINFFGWGELCAQAGKGQAAGTFLYMAPELFKAMYQRKNSCDLKSDIFSVGIILWELATQTHPKRNQHDIAAGTLEGFEREKRKISDNAKTKNYPRSGFFGPIIKKCLEKSPKNRIDANDAYKALQKLSP